MSEQHEVIYMNWEERERGWGSRPDGCSLHLTAEDYREFLAKYWNGMPDETPDEYSAPAGELETVTVSQALYDKIAAKEHGLRIWNFAETKFIERGYLVRGENASGWVPLK